MTNYGGNREPARILKLMLRCSGGGYRKLHKQNQYSDQTHVVSFLARASVPTLYQTGMEIEHLEFLGNEKSITH